MFTRYLFAAVYLTHIRGISVYATSDADARKMAKANATRALVVICVQSAQV